MRRAGVAAVERLATGAREAAAPARPTRRRRARRVRDRPSASRDLAVTAPSRSSRAERRTDVGPGAVERDDRPRRPPSPRTSSARWAIDLSAGSRSLAAQRAALGVTARAGADVRRRQRSRLQAVHRDGGTDRAAACLGGRWRRCADRDDAQDGGEDHLALLGCQDAAVRCGDRALDAARARGSTSWPWSSSPRVCWTATASSARSSRSAAMRASTSSMRPRSRASSTGRLDRRPWHPAPSAGAGTRGGAGRPSGRRTPGRRATARSPTSPWAGRGGPR